MRHLLVPVWLGAAMAAHPAAAQVFEVGVDGGFYRLPAGPASTAAPPCAVSGPAPPEITRWISEAAQDHGLSPALLDAVARQESAYRQSAVSPKGAIGVMQLMPQTASALHVDPYDPRQNIQGGAAYLRRLLDQFDGDIERALGAYNAGPGAVVRYDGLPPYAETRTYVARGLEQLARAAAETCPAQGPWQ